MKKMLIILMIMTACLVSPVFAVPNGLTNPSFEDDTDADNIPDDWTLTGAAGYATIYVEGDAANAKTGDDYCELGRGTASWSVIHNNQDKDIPAVAASDYTISVYMKFASGVTSANPALKIEWYKALDAVYEGPDYLGENTSTAFTVTDTYVQYSYTYTAPTNTLFARATVIAGDAGGDGGVVLVDDVSLCEGTSPCADYGPTLVSPANATFIDPAGYDDDLVWINPESRNGTDTITCDVWYRIGDPNMDPSFAVKIVDGLAVETVNIVTAEQAAVVLGNDYFWRVTCYDPDTGGASVPIATVGNVWSFTTINTAPSAEAGYDQNEWLVGGTVTVVLNPKPNANDDVDDYPGPLTAVTSTTGGTFDTTAGEDPNTITFTAAGTYTITMLADDGALTDTDSFDITVYDEGTAEDYLIAHYPFDADALDATVNNHDGTLNGDAAIDPNSQVGAGSLRLDGTGDYVFIADSAHPTDANVVTWADFIDTAITDPNNQVTMSVWIKPTTWTAAYTQIVTKGYPGGYRLTRGDYDGVTYVTDGMPWDGGTVWGSDMYSMGDGEWHHLVGTWDGGGGALYIDGNFQYRLPQPHGTLLTKNGMQLQIGANEGADSSQHFNGLIDDVRIYDVGLSHAEVLKLYISQGGSGTCGEVYTAVDLTQDCVVNLADFAMFAFEWLDCRDPITCP